MRRKPRNFYRLRISSVGNSQSLGFERLQCDLLRQHTVARSQLSFRREAPLADLIAGGIELVDVHHLPVPNSIARAGIGSDDIKMLAGIVLRGLLGREPLAEKVEGFLLCLPGGRPRSPPPTIAIIRQTPANIATPTSADACTDVIRLRAVV